MYEGIGYSILNGVAPKFVGKTGVETLFNRGINNAIIDFVAGMTKVQKDVLFPINNGIDSAKQGVYNFLDWVHRGYGMIPKL